MRDNKVSQMVRIFAKMKEGWLSNKDACFMCNSASGDRRCENCVKDFIVPNLSMRNIIGKKSGRKEKVKSGIIDIDLHLN